MIYAHKLSKSYKSTIALEEVSIDVKQGEICGILGPNGAGKSTLFKILCGLLTQDSGSFYIESNKPKPVGAIIEKPAFYDYLSAYENLSILSTIQGIYKDPNIIKDQLERVGLPLNRKDPVKNFSLGMKQRLGIAIALLNEPDCLILDEPFLGLDPLGIKSLRTLIKDLALDKKLAILISSHLLDEISQSSENLHVIQSGKIVRSGTSSEILNSTTKYYRICGKNLCKSIEIKEYLLSDGNCITIPLTVEHAPALLTKLIDDGVEVTYFGPEKNLDELYQ